MKKLQLLLTLLVTSTAAALDLNRVSAYNLSPSQTDARPLEGACGTNLAQQASWARARGVTLVAVSRDLFYRPSGSRRCGARATLKLRSGQTLNVMVVDTMAARYSRSVDILMHLGQTPTLRAVSYRRALDFGVQRGTWQWN
jgi:hypothetical protein